MNFKYFIVSFPMLFSISTHASEQIGSVDTAWKLLGVNHKIVIDVFDDPMVEGVSCYISRAKTGGVKGSLGLAEDRSEASVACRQVAPIVFKEAVPKQAEALPKGLLWCLKGLGQFVRLIKNVKLWFISFILKN